MVRKYCLVIATLMVAACGGGGGGGGSPAPSNLGTPDGGNPNQNPQTRTGVFSDSIVSGLRYVQGDISGITNSNGQFTYNPTSKDQVVFFVGNIELGSAAGAAVVTPFDLNIDGGTINLNRGLNVARLLISVDEDNFASNGIKIPDTLQGMVADLPWELEPSRFSEDAAVQLLLSRIGISELVSTSEAVAHLLENSATRSKVERLSLQLQSSAPVSVRWNDGLLTNGLLAAVSAANGEKLFIFSSDNVSANLHTVVYVDANQNYVVLRYTADGEVVFHNVNGTVKKIITRVRHDDASVLAPYDVDNYIRAVELTSVNPDSLQVQENLGYRHAANQALMGSIMQRLNENMVSQRDIVEIASLILLDVERLGCSELTECAQLFTLSKAMNYALSDQSFFDNSINVQVANVDPAQECVAIPLVNKGVACGQNTALSSLLSSVTVSISKASVVWESKLKVASFPGLYDGIRFEYSDYNPDVAGIGKDWWVENGPVPAPWTEAIIEADPVIRWIALPDGAIYYEVSWPSQEFEATFLDCQYYPQDHGRYAGLCDISVTNNTSEKRVIIDIFKGMMKLAVPRSDVLRRCGSTSYSRCEVKILPLPLPDTYLSEALALTEGKDRYFRVFTGFEAPTELPFGGLQGVEHLNAGDTIHSHRANLEYFFSAVGIIHDPRLRLSEGHVDLHVSGTLN